MEYSRLKKIISYGLVLFVGISITFYMFYSELSDLRNYYHSRVSGKVLAIENTHSGGGPIFKLENLNTNINLHIRKSEEEEIIVGDSIYKDESSTKIFVFRKNRDKWIILREFSINDSETFYDWVVSSAPQ